MIRSERLGPVHVVTLARPERRNALTPEMLDELRAAILTHAGSRALVLAGDGPMFCAGFDLTLCEADPAGHTMRRLLAGLSEVVRTLRSLPIPVVIASHAGAIAGGCALLGGADLVVADRACKIGYPVHRLGVSPAVSAPTLARLVGPGPARRLQLEGSLIRGDEAHNLGLVHTLVETPAEVRPAALDQANLLASKPGDGVPATRRWFRQVEDTLLGDGAFWADAALGTSLSLVAGPEERTLLRAPGRPADPKAGGRGLANDPHRPGC